MRPIPIEEKEAILRSRWNRILFSQLFERMPSIVVRVVQEPTPSEIAKGTGERWPRVVTISVQASRIPDDGNKFLTLSFHRSLPCALTIAKFFVLHLSRS